MEIKELDSFDKDDLRIIPTDLNELAEVISDTLSLPRCKEVDYIYLKSCLLELQRIKPLSKELVRYILLTNTMCHNDAIEALYTDYGKHIVKTQMRKLNSFMRDNKIRVHRCIQFYKVWKHFKGNIVKEEYARFIHTFRLT
jgi:hypothetical protein